MATKPKTDPPIDEPDLEPEEAESKPDPIPVLDKVPAKKPRYFVAGNTFYAQMEDGWELAAPVKLSVRNIRKLRASIAEAEDELDQLVTLFEILGDEETVEKLTDADFGDALAASMAYFQAWEEKTQARLGESGRSSTS